MNRGQFERLLDGFARPAGEHREKCFSSDNTYCCLNQDKVRDFIWEQFMGREKTVRRKCLYCTISFPLSRKDQKFHSPACKSAYFQAKRRRKEKGKKDYQE